MSDDLQAARERVLVHQQYENKKGQFGKSPYWRGLYWDFDAINTDNALLADAYCELFDETPIDEEWAHEINVRHEAPESTPCVVSITPFARYEHPDAWMVECIDGRTGDVHGFVIATTRGAVRLLLLAMGVKSDGK